ncbi:helix-turn-helix domain-containing protein [Streptomyces coffeae]|uniref:Helix-turn-helix domain-containing protein n=1 Tax=Streptomyces coffeae TaxID=621382 RepID=A0ABS1NJV4_9ACTN|nr:helix-turn-helix transcriptional regulator [Streptomyces coffeae]MBL1100165.1 helix-turn-helix domain-containing protein [Streptomyces coffeae]
MPNASPASPASPDVLRQQVGELLRRWRERAGISVETAVSETALSAPSLWRWEAGTLPRKPKTDTIEALLRLYGAADDEIAAILDLAEKAAARPWWHPYRFQLPGWVQASIAYAESSTMIRIYAPHRIPDLLQTPGYAQARGCDEVGLSLLARRQAVLHRATPERPRLWVILDESIFCRSVSGDPEVLCEQIDHLIYLTSRRRFTLQIVPLTTTGQPAAEPFTIYRLAPQELPDVVCREVLDGGQFTDDRDSVGVYRVAWDAYARALSPMDSLALLKSIHA